MRDVLAQLPSSVFLCGALIIGFLAGMTFGLRRPSRLLGPGGESEGFTDRRLNGGTNAPLMIVVAGISIALALIVAVVVITVLRPTQDNTAIIMNLIGFATLTLAGIYQALKTNEAKQQVDTKLDKVLYVTNGNIRELIEKTRAAAAATGKLEGHAEAKQELAPVIQALTAPAVEGTPPATVVVIPPPEKKET